ncbi:spermidine/putrescine ABC transporter ATP-binding subunit [Schinkia azotoformans MEV2011]|uniref:Spermidine/putrescine import ATP-binding protein PotA n=1 Tax=Schinkia azotoformans MEV2011 TaxID=1348973 RepID=A0A072NNN1_SCHAZ|nr:ABC transporter ATP-binding protein [Schinkia azotoformans]KEF38523.1 spermidine/putrescine ABC transporter ATP-binding subunit [Schinkia azotoformans MEV2011]MEC1695132.1 ABC transporter ATP-binding protein [Schinkia azotoformans]MEC1723809.1 ABC transporter ATP-binding protein [Schinkia azotoformans]MEC1742360.1 ABC transporter ATP-binding protein [Schinkia azotoformans]MEC1766226.1 ABC transporter ATP-binding protein [Schinkia azotoformans]
MSINTHLSLKNATKYYKKFKAVDDINLDIRNGEFVTILGPSGSGKTSLLKLIAGFEPLSSGHVFLNYEDITTKKPYERNIGMLFQNYALFPHMTVGENIAYPLKLRKFSKSQIKELVKNILDLVHLSDYAKRYPHQLSGGQQQRVALARAIVFNPPLLLLDEPLGALDKNLREAMQLEIKHIQERVGITTVSVTHDQEEALTMSDRICVMNKGRIEQIASPRELYEKPVNRFVAEFIGEINLLGGKVVAKDKEAAVIKLLNDDSISLKVEGTPAIESKDVFIAVRPENMHITSDVNQFENYLKVAVYEKIYIGDAVKLKVKTGSEQSLTVKVPAYYGAEMDEGKEIILGWNGINSTLIPFDEAI